MRPPTILIETNLGEKKLVKIYARRKDQIELERLTGLSKPKYDLIITATKEQTEKLLELRPEFEAGDLSFDDLLTRAGLTEFSLLIDLESNWKASPEEMGVAVELCKQLPNEMRDHPAFNQNRDQFVEVGRPQEYGIPWPWGGRRGWTLEASPSRGMTWSETEWPQAAEFFRDLDPSKFFNEVLGQFFPGQVSMGANSYSDPYPGCNCVSCLRARAAGRVERSEGVRGLRADMVLVDDAEPLIIDEKTTEKREEARGWQAWEEAVVNDGTVSTEDLQKAANAQRLTDGVKLIAQLHDTTLVEVEYDQIEARILASLGVPLDFFNGGEDPHEKTAREIFDIPEGGPVTPEQRRKAKAVNFRETYGGENPYEKEEREVLRRSRLGEPVLVATQTNKDPKDGKDDDPEDGG